MNFTNICRTVALVLFVLLLLAAPSVGLLVTRIGSRDVNDWIHAFCLTQTVLLAACLVYGPGRFIVRMPLAFAWGLAIGFSLATHNLITSQGRASLAAGAILVGAGTLSPLVIFAVHRWRTRALLAFSTTDRTVTRPGHQLSLQTLLILTGAFAATGVAARAAITAPADPFGTDHDTLIVHMWVGFFPCLAVAPTLLVVFRPSWKIVLACGFFVLVTLADPFLLGLCAPIFFNDKTFFPSATWNTFFPKTSWDAVREIWIESLLWHGQAVIAVGTYAVLARAAGLQMVVPDQSNDKNPNPSAQPATDAGCVQD